MASIAHPERESAKWACSRYTETMYSMRRLKSSLLSFLALALMAAPAWPQWQWLDVNGKKVFSDLAPPSDVPDHNILSRPGAPATRKAVAEAKAGPTAVPGPEAPKVTDPAAAKKAAELETKKKQAEDAEKARQKAEEQRAAATRADNCQRAQTALNTLNTGTPLRTMNAQGERIYLDDSARQAEKMRLQAAVQQNCTR